MPPATIGRSKVDQASNPTWWPRSRSSRPRARSIKRCPSIRSFTGSTRSPRFYGTTLKAIIHEMFGDGIMSAIDFELDVRKKEDPKGDRVVVTMNGKFLPYKKW